MGLRVETLRPSGSFDSVMSASYVVTGIDLNRANQNFILNA